MCASVCTVRHAHVCVCVCVSESPISATNTLLVRFLAIAAFDQAHQWPHRFIQMYRPKERLHIHFTDV